MTMPSEEQGVAAPADKRRGRARFIGRVKIWVDVEERRFSAASVARKRGTESCRDGRNAARFETSRIGGIAVRPCKGTQERGIPAYCGERRTQDLSSEAVHHTPEIDPSLMEGRLAIFTEKWIVALVRVHSIRVTDRGVLARIQAIPTQGLYGKNEIEIGCIHEHLQFGKEIWVGRDYGKWVVYFAPALIEEVLAIAASLPKDWVYDPADRDFDGHHAALTKPLWEYEKREAPNPDLEVRTPTSGSQ